MSGSCEVVMACRRSLPLLALPAAICIGGNAMAQSAEWKPDRTTEIIVGTAPGAAPDRTARTIQRIWKARGIDDGAVSVINKPGGGNVIALTYLNQHPGNGHYLMIGNLNVIISHAIGISPFAHTDFAWIAMLFDEFFALALRADSPLTTGRDVVARMLKDPAAITVGVSTSIGGTNHLAAALALQRAGVDPRRVRFVAFKGSADSITALLGGHIDAAATAVSAVVPHARSGQLRIVAVSSPQRLGGPLSAVPTWLEQGVNATMTTFRAIIAPKHTPAAAVAYWERRFALLSEAAEWKSDLESNLWSWNFMDATKTAAAVAAYAEDVESVVNTLGLRKTR